MATCKDDQIRPVPSLMETIVSSEYVGTCSALRRPDPGRRPSLFRPGIVTTILSFIIGCSHPSLSAERAGIVDTPRDTRTYCVNDYLSINDCIHSDVFQIITLCRPDEARSVPKYYLSVLRGHHMVKYAHKHLHRRRGQPCPLYLVHSQTHRDRTRAPSPAVLFCDVCSYMDCPWHNDKHYALGKDGDACPSCTVHTPTTMSSREDGVRARTEEECLHDLCTRHDTLSSLSRLKIAETERKRCGENAGEVRYADSNAIASLSDVSPSIHVRPANTIATLHSRKRRRITGLDIDIPVCTV